MSHIDTKLMSVRMKTQDTGAEVEFTAVESYLADTNQTVIIDIDSETLWSANDLRELVSFLECLTEEVAE